MTLFTAGPIRLHSGARSTWKIECDVLTPTDWRALAQLVASRISFGRVVGVPTGGLRFAEALEPYATSGTTLIVDDVLTTGASMEEARSKVEGPSRGVVLFARGKCPEWVTAVWSLAEALR